MKRLILVCALLLSIIAIAQNDELPSKVSDVFGKQYPNARSINWYAENDNYKIEFDMGSDSYTALYSAAGTWIETGKVISDAEIPPAVVNAFNKKYAGSEISFAELVETVNKETFYRINAYSDDEYYIITAKQSGEIVKVE